MRRYRWLAIALLVAAMGLATKAWAQGAADKPTSPTVTSNSAATSGTVDLTLVQELGRLADGVEAKFRSISTGQWLGAFLAVLIGLILQKVLLFIFNSRLADLAKRTKFDADDVLIDAVDRPVSYFPFTFGIIIAGLIIGLRTGAGDAKTWFGNTVITLIVINVAWVFFNLVDVISHILKKMADRTETNLDDQLVPLVSKALKVIVVLLAITTLGSWVGGPFKGILAGLGLGGLAFALAAKDTVSNLFGYAVIFADKPFFVGDVVKINGVMGSVEQLGARSVRLRTFDKTLVIMPNSEVANATIENITARPTRRVFTSVGLTYETTADQMEKAVESIRKIVTEHPKLVGADSVVAFESFGASSLDIRVAFYVMELAYPDYLAIVQEINLAIMRVVAEQGLSIAFPTRTVYLRQDVDGEPVFPSQKAD